MNLQSPPVDSRPMIHVDVEGTKLPWGLAITNSPLMWRPLSVIWVTCCAPVGAVTVPLLPDAVWPGESSGNHIACPDLSPKVCGRVYTACVPSAMLHGGKMWGPNTSNLERLHHNDHVMIHWICGTKNQDETPSASLLKKLKQQNHTPIIS